MAFKDDVQELQNGIFAGQLLEVFDKFYHDDVVMEEVGQKDQPARHGKADNRAYEEKFLASLEAFHGGGVTHIAYDEAHQVAMIESWMDVSFKGAGRVKMSQVSVQQWQDGKVIAERFYHS